MELKIEMDKYTFWHLSGLFIWIIIAILVWKDGSSLLKIVVYQNCTCPDDSLKFYHNYLDVKEQEEVCEYDGCNWICCKGETCTQTLLRCENESLNYPRKEIKYYNYTKKGEN